MSDVTAVQSMANARETGLKVVTGSLEESRKSARIFIRAIYCLIVLGFVSFEVVTLVTEHRKEETARQAAAPRMSQQSCPSSSKTGVNRCMITKAGILVKSEPSINPDEFKFCWVQPEGSIIESKWLGPDLLQIKSGGDDFQIKYKWIRKSDLVDGKCPASY